MIGFIQVVNKIISELQKSYQYDPYKQPGGIQHNPIF